MGKPLGEGEDKVGYRTSECYRVTTNENQYMKTHATFLYYVSGILSNLHKRYGAALFK